MIDISPKDRILGGPLTDGSSRFQLESSWFVRQDPRWSQEMWRRCHSSRWLSGTSRPAQRSYRSNDEPPEWMEYEITYYNIYSVCIREHCHDSCSKWNQFSVQCHTNYLEIFILNTVTSFYVVSFSITQSFSSFIFSDVELQPKLHIYRVQRIYSLLGRWNMNAFSHNRLESASTKWQMRTGSARRVFKIVFPVLTRCHEITYNSNHRHIPDAIRHLYTIANFNYFPPLIPKAFLWNYSYH